MLSGFCGRNVWDLHFLKGGGSDVSVVVCVFCYAVGRPACRMCQVKVVLVWYGARVHYDLCFSEPSCMLMPWCVETSVSRLQTQVHCSPVNRTVEIHWAGMNNLSGLDDIGIVFSTISTHLKSELIYGLPSCWSFMVHGIVIVVIGYYTVNMLGPSMSITCSKSTMAIPISLSVITNTTSAKDIWNECGSTTLVPR